MRRDLLKDMRAVPPQRALLNLWCIVHLIRGQDQRLIDRFAAFDDTRALPEFIALYIRRDLEIVLSRKD